MTGRGKFLAPILIALFGAGLLYYTYSGAPVVPIWDGWTWIAHAKAWFDGGLAGLWQADPLIHGQHLYALPSAIALLSGPWLDYSFRPFAFLSCGLLIALGIMFQRVARGHGLGHFESVGVFVAVASLRHYENLLLGFQFGVVLCVGLGSAAILVAATRRDRKGLLLAGALALGSLASSSGGLLAVVAVLLARWLDLDRPRRVLLIGLACLAAMVVSLFVLMRLAGLPGVLLDAVKVVGGGVVGGRAALPAGCLLLAAALARIAAQLRRARHLDALGGLALFGLLGSLAVAVARSPIATPESRHAIFALPLVGVLAIDFFRLPLRRASRALAAAAFAFALAWLQADAKIAALDYRRFIGAWDIDTRLAVAAVAADVGPNRAEIARVNNGPTEFIRSLMQFARDRRLMIFGSRYHGVEIHNGLPSRVSGAPCQPQEDGTLLCSGPADLHEVFACRFDSGCSARLSVDSAVRGQATFGFVVRHANGQERVTRGLALRPGGKYHEQTIRAQAVAGETLEPYIRVAGPSDVVRIRAFSSVWVRNPQFP